MNVLPYLRQPYTSADQLHERVIGSFPRLNDTLEALGAVNHRAAFPMFLREVRETDPSGIKLVNIKPERALIIGSTAVLRVGIRSGARGALLQSNYMDALHDGLEEFDGQTHAPEQYGTTVLPNGAWLMGMQRVDGTELSVLRWSKQKSDPEVDRISLTVKSEVKAAMGRVGGMLANDIDRHQSNILVVNPGPSETYQVIDQPDSIR